MPPRDRAQEDAEEESDVSKRIDNAVSAVVMVPPIAVLHKDRRTCWQAEIRITGSEQTNRLPRPSDFHHNRQMASPQRI
jgi:hypothetical protein